MKNIHLIPTDKPSRLHLGNSGLVLCDLNFGKNTINGQNIYITSNEEIKDVRPHKDKWQLEKEQILNKFPNYLTDLSECKLIILTTDQDLIKDGVQAIDDEFLEWFVNNPGCEKVEVEKDQYIDKTISDTEVFTDYIIIIPQEESKQELNLNCFDCNKSLQDCTCTEDTINMKQETLEEVANEYSKKKYSIDYGYCEEDYYISFLSFRDGAKWQQERSYSELVDLLERLRPIYKEDSDLHQKYEEKRVEIIEQFKKK